MVLFQLPPSAPCPRLCVMIKKSLNQEYGFNLHAEKVRGQFIGAIDNDSPADISGLRSGDRIFAVNGALVQGESHKQVIQRIKENPLQCELLVISEEGAEWYFKNKIQITPSLPNVIRVCREWEDSMRPNNNRGKRLSYIYLTQNDSIFINNNSLNFKNNDDEDNNNSDKSMTFFYTLNKEMMKNKKRLRNFSSPQLQKITRNVKYQSFAADSLSLSSFLSLSPQVENKSNMVTFKGSSYASLVSQSQKSPKICEETIKEDNSRINSGYNTNLIQQPMLTLQTAPRPRLCYLRKNDPSEEFGFNVHLENGKGHYIGVVDYNGIAYNAGLETGQRIVGINNQIIYPNTPHKEVVTLIKRTPLEARLLVASEDVDKWYIDNNIEYNFDNCIYFKQNLSPSTIINSNKIPNSRSRLDPQINNLSPIPRSNNARSMSCGSNRTNKSTSSSENDWKESQNKLTGNDIGNKTFLNKDNKKNYKYCEEITVKKSFVDNVVHSNNPFEENDDESNNMNVILEKEPEITECRIITPKPRSRSPVPIANCKPFGGNVDVNSIHINNSVNNNDIIKYSDYSNNKKSNMDIFSLSAKEARKMMALNRKKDPRKQNTMSIEQKYKLISSL
ncbi:GH04176p [Strongyloides ratti]|uniref:GH04176p n=1 Tax=Strongyloides ratti TaxID=34506 RepID=A0A090KQU6_STRRB|nr:GH04176p [Strongyloides ratti]CEF59908.1 GH04176p [Strongyloides ratti]